MNSIQLPPTLKKGDKVIILSPSSKIDKRYLKGATERLQSWGLIVELSEHAASANGYYASSIKHRVEDLQKALDDESAKAILCSRGGYGAVHLVGSWILLASSSIPNGLSVSATSPSCTT